MISVKKLDSRYEEYLNGGKLVNETEVNQRLKELSMVNLKDELSTAKYLNEHKVRHPCVLVLMAWQPGKSPKQNKV